MQDIERINSFDKRMRRIFKFKSGLWVETYWHLGMRKWAIEAYSKEEDKWIGIGFSENKKLLPGLLRMDIAVRKNPKIGEVTKKIAGTQEGSIRLNSLKSILKEATLSNSVLDSIKNYIVDEILE